MASVRREIKPTLRAMPTARCTQTVSRSRDHLDWATLPEGLIVLANCAWHLTAYPNPLCQVCKLHSLRWSRCHCQSSIILPELLRFVPGLGETAFLEEVDSV